MSNETIPLGDLPLTQEGQQDYLVGVQGGKARRFLIPEIQSAAADLESQIDGLIAEKSAQFDADAAPVITGLGYAVPVPYAAGILIDGTRQTVEYNGETYAPVSSTLPFTTSGTFETAKFRLIQGVSGADLAATDGAALVGHAGGTVRSALVYVESAIAEVTPEMYGAVGDGVADDSEAMDLAVIAAAGGTLRLSYGKTYLLASVRYGTGTALRVRSNTTIIAYGATVKRGGDAVALLLSNNADGVTGGYDANENISIYGGTWDSNGAAFTGISGPMGFVHARNITIVDAMLKGIKGAHHLEINACSRVTVRDCTCEGGAEEADDTLEAIQLDGAISSAHWGVGPYDNTFCSNIKIEGCTLTDCGTGIGSHSSVSGKKHTTITIRGCTISSAYYCGIRMTNWEGVVIDSNQIYGGYHAIRGLSDATTPVQGVVITNNRISSVGLTARTGAGGGHGIYLIGNSAGTEKISEFVISNNEIDTMNQPASGSAIKANYCSAGTIANNQINGTSTGHGIDLFDTGGTIVNANRAVGNGAGYKGISISSCVADHVTANQVNSINVVNSDRCLVLHNNVFTSSGLTTSNNTNTTVKDNLQNTVFA